MSVYKKHYTTKKQTNILHFNPLKLIHIYIFFDEIGCFLKAFLPLAPYCLWKKLCHCKMCCMLYAAQYICMTALYIYCKNTAYMMFSYPPLPLSLSFTHSLMSARVQATCTCTCTVRDIHFLSVYEAFMNYKTMTTRDQEWGKGG